MALLDWILVAFGVAVALAGSWIQLHPERVVPRQTGPLDVEWQLDSAAISKIRLLGGFFLCMGAFFTLQMAIDLMQGPWWTGTISGLATAIAAVTLVNARVGRQQRRRRSIQQSPLPRKVLELR